MADEKKNTVVKEAKKTKVPMAEETIDSIEGELSKTKASEDKPKKSVKKKHDSNELIICRSVVFGELNIIGPKTKLVYQWSNEGDVQEVEYQDLMSLKALRHRYIFDPFIIIEDEELYEEWKADLEPVYKKVGDINIKGIFELPQRQFVAKLKQLPDSLKESVKNAAYSMIQNGTLYDLRKINAMDEVLQTDLKTMI